MEKDLLDGHEGQPLKNTIRIKGSEDNVNILKASKAIDIYTITRPPYSRYYGN